MSINIGYFARVDLEKSFRSKLEVAELIVNGELEDDSLYVFYDDNLWEFAAAEVSKIDLAAIIDGFRVIAPGFRRGHTNDVDFSEIDPGSNVNTSEICRSNYFTYPPKGIYFKKGENCSKHMLAGWAPENDIGIPCNGNPASMMVHYQSLHTSNLRLLIECSSVIDANQKVNEIIVLVNGRSVGMLKPGDKNLSEIYELNIPEALLLDNNGKLLITFDSSTLQPSALVDKAPELIERFTLVSLVVKDKNDKL
jgi:hypothetical protein